MNKGELITEFRARMPDCPIGVITDAQLLIWLNQGALDFVRKTMALKTSSTFSIVAAQKEYTLPSDCLYVDSVHFYDSDSIWQKLTKKTRIWFDQSIANWEDDTSDEPIAYYQRGNVIGLYKEPDTAGTDNAKVYYTEKPDEMTADSSDPFNDDTSLSAYHDAVVLFAAWKAKQARNEWKKAGEIRSEYFKIVAEAKREIHFEPDLNDQVLPYHKRTRTASSKDDPLNQAS